MLTIDAILRTLRHQSGYGELHNHQHSCFGVSDPARLRQTATHTGTTREKKWKPKDARNKPPSDT